MGVNTLWLTVSIHMFGNNMYTLSFRKHLGFSHILTFLKAWKKGSQSGIKPSSPPKPSETHRASGYATHSSILGII